MRTPCTEPPGVLNETYQYACGGWVARPGSVSIWKRSFVPPLCTYGCEISSECRSVPGVPVRLSPLTSERIGRPGALHGVGGGGATTTFRSTSFDAGLEPRAFTSTIL